MVPVWNGIPAVCCYIDDILITANSEAEQLQRLETASTISKSLNQSEACQMQSEVEYLGHKIDAIGINPLADRIKEIRSAKVPENVTELRQLIDLINYYGKFLNQLSTTLAPCTACCELMLNGSGQLTVMLL